MAKKIGSLFVEFGATVDGFMAAMGKAEKGLQRMGSRMSRLGQQMSVGVSLPLIAIAKHAFETAADFEASMNKVSALGDITGDDLKKLEAQALELGKKTQFSAKQAADGMAELAAAGFNTTQIMAAMPGVLDLAAAAQVDVARASEIAVSTMGAFQLSADQAGRVADVLASASARGVLSIDDLAEAMKYVAPVSQATGRSLEETAAAISLLSNAGIKGSQAGTALRMGMIRFVKPTKQAQEVIDRLNLSLSDGKGHIKPLVDIIDQLAKKNANLADVTKLAGVEASTAWMALVQQGAPALDTLTKAIENDKGAADRMATTLRQGLKGGWEQMTGSIETASIALGKTFEPVALRVMKALEGLANKATDLFQAFGQMDPVFQEAVAGVVGLLAVLGPLLAIAGPLLTAFGTLTGGFKLFAGAILAIGTPVGAVMVLLGAVAVAAVEIYDNWEGIEQFFSDMWESISSTVEDNVNSLVENWKIFWYEFGQGVEKIKQWLLEMGQAIVDFVNNSIEFFKKLGEGIYTFFVDKLTGARDAVLGFTDDVAEFFEGLYDTVVGHSSVPDLIDGIEEEFKKLEDVMVQPSKKAAMETAAAFEEALQITKENLSEVDYEKAFQALKKFQDALAKGDKFKSAKAALRDLKKEMKGLTHDMEEAGKQAEDFNKAIGNVLGKVGGKTGNILQGLGEALFGTDKNGAPNQINGWLSSLFGGDSESGGLGKMIADQLGMSLDEATAAVNEYGASVIHVFESLQKVGKSTQETIDGVTESAFTAVGAYFGGQAGGELGHAIGDVVGDFLGSAFGGKSTNAQTKARKQVEKYLEDIFAKIDFRAIGKDGKLEQIQNIIFGSSDRFNDPGWVDQFKKYGDEAMNVFGGLGVGLTKVLGIAEDIGPQIGLILAENLNGNLDNARLLFQSLGISVQQYEDALVAAGDAGQMSWHEVEVALQGVYAASQPGLVGIGKFEDAFQQLIDSGGRGKRAIQALANVAIEAKDAGISTLDELRQHMMQDARFTPEQISALFTALSQRGITSLDQLAEVSSRTGGGVVADMESLGFAFAEVADEIQATADKINQIDDNTEKNVHFNFTSTVDDTTQQAIDAGAFDEAGIQPPTTSAATTRTARGLKRIGEAAAAAVQASMPVTSIGGASRAASVDSGRASSGITVNVDARHAAAGSEHSFRRVINEAIPEITRAVANRVADRRTRGGSYGSAFD